MGKSNLLFESIFQRKFSAADTNEFLTQVTNEHPYFAPAQFLLLLKLEKGTSEYRQQAAKTAVLFNNPHWLQFQLEEKQVDADETEDTIAEDDSRPAVQKTWGSVLPETLELNENADNGKMDIGHPETKPFIEDSGSTPIILETIDAEQLATAAKESEEIEPAEADAETALSLPAATEPFFIAGESTETANDGDLTAAVSLEEITPDTVAYEAAEISTHENGVAEIIPEIQPEQVVIEPLPAREEKAITENEVFEVADEHAASMAGENEADMTGHQYNGHFNNDSSPLVNETETETEEDPTVEEEIQPLNFKLSIDTPDTTQDSIIFEPLHTSDYFASLGIKLSGEATPNDKLGKQLKSFTEWLKTMKKLHTDQLPQQGDQAEISVQKLAELSNKKDTVVTEAMAEVLLRQGKADKAIEVYKKLSLFNPSKSAYFASKIDQLKEH